jgi:predicted peptidase
MCWALCAVGGLIAAESWAAPVSDFLDFTLKSGATTLLPGRLYVPPESVIAPDVERPLILFLHGSGESGTNNTAQVNDNINFLLSRSKTNGAFLYAPQTNAGWGSGTILDRVNSMIDQALIQYPVDPTKIYVTGLSMGGGGTWNMLSRFPDRFAAGVPICAVWPSGSFNAAEVGEIPIWAFHARDDSVVPVTATRDVLNTLLSVAGEPLPTYPPLPPATVTSDFNYASSVLDLKYSEYRFGGHGIWGRVYFNPGLYEWMFAQSTVPEPAGGLIAMTAFASVFGAVRHRRPRAAVA